MFQVTSFSDGIQVLQRSSSTDYHVAAADLGHRVSCRMIATPDGGEVELNTAEVTITRSAD